jgi:hypothetical protein
VADALASREELVRQADRHQRQGRNDLAIGIYERLAGQTPTDWNVVKQLADLCERAGQREAAAARFLQLADHYFEEGFHPRASALYRKVLKLDPNSERALCQLAEIALEQKLKVDARQALTQVLTLRRRRGDTAGAEAIAARLAEVEGIPAVPAGAVAGAEDGAGCAGGQWRGDSTSRARATCRDGPPPAGPARTRRRGPDGRTFDGPRRGVRARCAVVRGLRAAGRGCAVSATASVVAGIDTCHAVAGRPAARPGRRCRDAGRPCGRQACMDGRPARRAG